MAWSIVGVSTSVETLTTTHTLTEPAGCTTGDLLIACIATRSTATTGVTLPSGWTLVNQQMTNNALTTTGAIASGTMAYIVRGASAPALGFTHPAGISVALGRIVAYRGGLGAVDANMAVTTTTNTLSVNVTGLTTTAADDLIVALCAGGQEAAWSAFKSANAPSTASGATDTTTTPSTTTWIERADVQTTNGNDTSLGVFDAVKTTAGATGNFTATASLGAGHVVIVAAFRSPATTADAWNIADKSAALTLSNSDKTATIASLASSGVRSTTKYASGAAGKYYAEFLAGQVTSTQWVGIKATAGTINATNSQNVHVAASTGTITRNLTTIGNIGAYVTSDVICVAWDTGAKTIWFRKNGGLWNADAAADPATATNGLDVSALLNTDHHLWFMTNALSNSVTVRTELAEYTQAVPSGFSSWMGEATGPTAYTLPAVAGTYALTGTAATPELARVLDAATAGSYALTGVDATLTKGAAVIAYNLSAIAGSYALSGSTAGLYRGREVLAVAGTYAVSGATVSLEVGREVAADPGSYALAGQTVSLELGKEVLALAGTYAVSGTAVTLRHDYKPVAVSGSYSLTGTPANLLRVGAKAIIGLPGSYTLTGPDAGLVKATNRVVAAVSGSYSLTGTIASLELGREALALAGSYALSGTTVSLEYGREVLALPASYALTGQTASLERGYEAAAVSGSYALTGQSTAFARTWKASAVAGSYALTGLPVNLLKPGAYAIIGLPGSYTLSGSAVTLSKTTAIARSIIAEAGSYHLTGSPVSLIWSGEGVPVTPPGTPYWGPSGGRIPKKQLRKAVKELLERQREAEKPIKPKKIAAELLAAIAPGGLGIREQRRLISLIAEGLRLELPSLFYSQPIIHDREPLMRAILTVMQRALDRIAAEEEEDEEAALLLLSA